MGGLLDVASVTRVGTPRSDAFDTPGCVLKSEVTDVCTPERETLTGDGGDGTGPDGNMFSVITSMESRLRCSPGEEEKWVADALEFEAEKAAGRVLFGSIGDNATNVSLAATTVGTVAAGASARASLSAALKEFWSRATGVRYQDTVVHLGVDRLLELVMGGAIEDSMIKNLKIPVASSPGYDANAIAVTGPITIEFGPDQTIQEHDVQINDLITEANRIGVLKFDPCISVRVA